MFFLRKGFNLFYHPTPHMFKQNHSIHFTCKYNVYEMTNKRILSYIDLNDIDPAPTHPTLPPDSFHGDETFRSKTSTRSVNAK